MRAGKKSKKAGIPTKATHDIQPPDALIEFMMSGWKAPAKKAPAKVPGLRSFKARRKALSKLYPGEALIIPTGHEKIRANDTAHRFRPASDFFYLTGNPEADCVLVLMPKRGGHESILFVEPIVDRSTPAFFTDRARGALWVGPRLGLAGSKVRYGVDATMPLTDLVSFFEQLQKSRTSYRVVRGISALVDKALPGDPETDAGLAGAISEMRLIKGEDEIASIRNAIDLTKASFENALRAMKTAKVEREVEAAFDARSRAGGEGVGFGTIVASGAHACVLHWTKNDGEIERDKLLLIDAGSEGLDLYTGDVTRTFPASGKYSKEQLEIYDLVVAAQEAAFRAVVPGNDFLEPHRAAMRVIAHGLEQLGILKEPAEESLREDRQTYKRYTLHSVSHLLGLDVHDSAAARPEHYRQGRLKPGMVLTIEPGIYLQLDDLTVPPKYRGIGIRVEEDVLVTRKGHEVLTHAIPRKSKDVEAWIARIWKRR